MVAKNDGYTCPKYDVYTHCICVLYAINLLYPFLRQRREEAREEARRQKAEEERIKQAAAARAAAEAEAARQAEAAAQQVWHIDTLLLSPLTSGSKPTHLNCCVLLVTHHRMCIAMSTIARTLCPSGIVSMCLLATQTQLWDQFSVNSRFKPAQIDINPS